MHLQRNIALDKTQIGLITFDNIVRNIFYLNTYHNKENLIKAIHRSNYTKVGIPYNVRYFTKAFPNDYPQINSLLNFTINFTF